jgi:hypothetical protein
MENLKSEGSTQRAGAGGQGDQVKNDGVMELWNVGQCS